MSPVWDADTTLQLAQLGEKVRNLKEHGLGEGASTRLLIYAGQLITQGITPQASMPGSDQLGRGPTTTAFSAVSRSLRHPSSSNRARVPGLRGDRGAIGAGKCC